MGKIFDRHVDVKTARISSLGMTALHVAASCGRSKFVVKFVKSLAPKELEAGELEARDQVGRTALHHVALAANVEAARALVTKSPDLPHLGDMRNLTPLYYAAKWRHPAQSQEMVDYLYQVTEDKEPCHPFTGGSAADLIVAMTASGCYGKVPFLISRSWKHPFSSLGECKDAKRKLNNQLASCY